MFDYSLISSGFPGEEDSTASGFRTAGKLIHLYFSGFAQILDEGVGFLNLSL
jgi:hypothetical protein